MGVNVENLIMNVHHHLVVFEKDDREFLDLARTLRQLKEADKAAFHQMYGSPRLGKRKAYYLVSIDKAFSTYPDRARLAKIGWTSLAAIATKVTSVNIESLLSLAESSTVKEVEATLKKKGKWALKKFPVTLHFSPEQMVAFVSAVQAHGAKLSEGIHVGIEAALIKALKSGPGDGRTR